MQDSAWAARSGYCTIAAKASRKAPSCAAAYARSSGPASVRREDEEALEVRLLTFFLAGLRSHTTVPRCQHHSKALAIKLKAFGPYHPEVDQTHDSMANAFDR